MTVEPIWLYGLDGTQVAAVGDYANLTIEDRLQAAETLTFSIRSDDPKAAYLVEDAQIRYGTRYYRIAEVARVRDGAVRTIDVVAEGLWIDLLNRKYVGTRTLSGMTPFQGLQTILQDSGWTAQSVASNAGTFSATWSDETILKMVRDWAELVNAEVLFDSLARTVRFVVQQGADRGLGFRYGRNLTAMKQTSIPPQATRLYAYGRDDIGLVAVNPTGKHYVENYGWYTARGVSLADARAQYRRDEVWVDKRYTNRQALYDAAVRRLERLSLPTATYEAKVVDLNALTGAAEVFQVGDTVVVDDATLGISLRTRVVRLKQYPLQPEKNEVELAFLATGLGDVPTGSPARLSLDGGTTFALYLDERGNVTVDSGSTRIVGAVGLVCPAAANVVVGSELDGTATGSGTLTVTYLWGLTPVGPTVNQAFTAGPFHLASTFAVPGLSGSQTLTVLARVTSGTGSVAVGPTDGRVYVLASGAIGGNVATEPAVNVAEDVTTGNAAGATDTATTATDAPTASTPTETVTTGEAHTTTDTVTIALT